MEFDRVYKSSMLDALLCKQETVPKTTAKSKKGPRYKNTKQ
ncbi:12403_t:CDS:2 [Ambispora gerdemannii]|uniref:12403_t:CDS:1 n=1 Tax=Ambispora gerdemannii TaxID=144530 RepID=A0A9N8ZI95_9GLOM|nr:12403_t:CDS:2 [Ambispora gerdemannii]